MQIFARLFCQCTGVDISDFAWQQAQLSLSRGGLGLRSLVHHSSAAFIASVCSSGFGSSLIHPQPFELKYFMNRGKDAILIEAIKMLLLKVMDKD